MRDAAPEPPFELELSPVDGGTSVRVRGELDLATAERFRRTVADALAVGPVVLDLAGLEFIDSSGVRALDAVLRDADRAGTRLRVGGEIHENVAQILDLVGVLDELPREGDGRP